MAGDLEKDMKSIMWSMASRSDFKRKGVESDADPIHFLVRYIPRLSVASRVRKLKQEGTIVLWKKHKNVLSKNFWKEHALCSGGYFVCSVGDTSPETIRNDRLNQG